MLLLGASAVLSGARRQHPLRRDHGAGRGHHRRDLPAGTSADPLWWSLALGADLGGNATPIGASANIVILAIAAKAGQPITFLEFVRYGVIVTTITVAASGAYIWLRYFALA